MSKFLKKIIILCSFTFIFMLFNVKTVHASTTFTTCTVNEPSYFRKTPGGEIMTDVDKSSILVKAPARLEVIEETNGFKKVRGNYYSNNYVGWISNNYLTDYRQYTTDDNYANVLRQKGFPESYILPLQKLHAIHPTWEFKVSKYGNGLSFNDVINGEYSPVSKNLINSPYTALRSTDGEAYNNGVYKQFEPGWYAASKQTIEFYIDPRNWLTENTIFMFEEQSYDPNIHTQTAVANMVKGTFLEGLEGAFISAGMTYKVNPISLIARVIQEQGADGRGLTAKMQSDGKTYYNYFNVNASGSSTDEIYRKALETAKANNWTTPQAAINGGASVISNNYVSSGQDTNYYQKFNTINDKALYRNQYMANVRVLPGESYNAYLTYHNAGKLNEALTFKIPVYNNMPDSTTLSINENGDNSLKSLKVSSCSFNFYSSVVNYTCTVDSSVNSVKVEAEKASPYSSVKGTGNYNLNSNSTIISVVVTASNGNQKTYNVTINKSNSSTNNNQNNASNPSTQNIDPSQIISGLGLNNRNNNIYGLNLGDKRENLISTIKNKYNPSSVVIKNKYNSDALTGNISTGDKLIINNTTYVIVINGDPSADGSIDVSDLAMVRANMLGKISFDTVLFDAADVNNDDKVDISDLAMVRAHMLGKIQITK